MKKPHILAVLVASLLATAASATEASRQVDLTVELKNLDGTVMRDPNTRPADDALPIDPSCDKCEAMTLRRIVGTALVQNYCPPMPPNAPASPYCVGEEKDISAKGDYPITLWGRAQLANRVYKDPKNVTLSDVEVKLIKRLVALRYPDGEVIAQVYAAIDPTAAPTDAK